VNPEQVLEIIESQQFDESGKLTAERVFTPEELHSVYEEKIQSKVQVDPGRQEKPIVTRFSKPGRFKQFGIFFNRNWLAKLSNRQYVILNLVQAPILALVVAFLTKYSGDEGYWFGLNKNFPSFLFMAIVVMLFQGMSLSAEEIIKDRFLLKRESFLRLSRFSYLNSKIAFVLLVSFVQSLLFVAVSYWILDMQDLFIKTWIILFSIALFANMVGLNISAGLDSVVTIYISIPLLIIPQILLCGLIVPFEDIQSKNTNQQLVPIVGDMMVSRWAFEALAVEHFMYNTYNEHYYDLESEISEYVIKSDIIIPELTSLIGTASYNMATGLKKEYTEKILRIIFNEMKDLDGDEYDEPFALYNEWQTAGFSRFIGDSAIGHLESLRKLYRRLYTSASSYKDQITSTLLDQIGKDQLLKLKDESHNDALRRLVVNETVPTILNGRDRFLVRVAPVYRYPRNQLGRAHFYAPVKIIMGYQFSTFNFNLIMISLMTLLLYLSLYYNWLRKLIQIGSTIQRVIK